MDSNQINPDLSVIIVNWNTRQLLAECLRSVKVNLVDLNIEAFVVDNGSSDGSQELVRTDFPEVTLIENRENLGFSKANNQAIRLCSGNYILLLNSDAFLTPHAVQKMIDAMESDLSIGIAGAHLVYPDGSWQVSHGALPTFWSEVASLFGLDKFQMEKGDQGPYQETGTVSGACLLIRKTLLDQVGLLDEVFFMFSEEVDLCNRCHKVGAKVIYVPSAMVIHTNGGSTGKTVGRIMLLYSGKLQYFYKHFGLGVKNRLKFMMLLAAACKCLTYRILRFISLGRIRKDDFWWAVSKKLMAMS